MSNFSVKYNVDSLPYLDRTVHPNFVWSHFIAPLRVRQPADEALLKHAGSLCVHVTEHGLYNHHN